MTEFYSFPHLAIRKRLRDMPAAPDGFTGMMAIHPTQVPMTNDAFTPTEEEIARALTVIAAFETHPGQAPELNGHMIDPPHLKAGATCD